MKRVGKKNQKNKDNSKWLSLHVVIFFIISFFILFELLILSFYGYVSVIPLIILVLLFILIYGLHERKKWSRNYGYAVLTLLIIGSLWWQRKFAKVLLSQLEFGENTLNALALSNLILVSGFVVIFILSLYLHVRLKSILNK